MSQNNQNSQSPQWLNRVFSQQPGESSLANEIAELRREIAGLRADLAPVPSLILTGRAALEEFKKLRQAGF